MGALQTMKKVGWSRYSLDEWLLQYGAWINSVRMKGGHCPDDLSISESYRAMQSTGYIDQARQKREYPACNITDSEADDIRYILKDARARGDILRRWIDLLELHHVHLYDKRDMARTLNLGRNNIAQDIKCARAFLHGRYGFLKIS